MQKVKDFLNTNKDIVLKIECENDGSELLFKMLDRIDSEWANEQWHDAAKMAFEGYFDIRTRTLEMPYDEFMLHCQYSKTWVDNLAVEHADEDASSVCLYLK